MQVPLGGQLLEVLEEDASSSQRDQECPAHVEPDWGLRRGKRDSLLGSMCFMVGGYFETQLVSS